MAKLRKEMLDIYIYIYIYIYKEHGNHSLQSQISHFANVDL